MYNRRLIARLDVKGPHLIKGVHLEGLRKIGNPQDYARRYYEQSADEIIYMDAVASLYGRNSLKEIVRHTTDQVFIPITVGGGVRTIDDVRDILASGADKVAINTAAIGRPELIEEVAAKFGSQCMVLSIEAKAQPQGGWEAYTDNGRERTGREVVAWAKEAVSRGAGEIFLTSVDREGTRRGFDVELVKSVSQAVSVPVVASGGMGTVAHLEEVIQQGHADAVAMADILHYDRMDIPTIRQEAIEKGVTLRALD